MGFENNLCKLSTVDKVVKVVGANLVLSGFRLGLVGRKTNKIEFYEILYGADTFSYRYLAS